MECSLEASILSKLVDATIELVKCVNIDVTGDGWYAQAMDGSHVALFAFTITKDSFSTLNVQYPITLGINLAALKSVMKILKSADILTLKSNRNMLDITGEHDGKNMRYELKLMDIESEQLDIPNMVFDYVVNLPSVEYVRTCQTAFGDTVCISIGTNIMFTSKGEDGNSHVQYTDVVVKSAGYLTLEFASRYLSLFSKGASLSKTVTLSMSPETPIRLEFSFDGGHMCYYLAPKIED
jgi:proliferating cell nuclear antigen